MKRLLSVLCAAATVFSSVPAEASITRLLSLGVDNWQIHDSANFWNNPALLKDVPDMVHFEVGTQAAAGGALTAGSQWGGFHKAWGRNVFGLYIRRPYGANDFSTIANPILTPMLGGMIGGAGVVGVTGLDTGGFGTDGPFGTTAASVTGITGAPSALTMDIADPVNFLDAFWAIPAGPFSFGMQFNYARNAPGEQRRNNYSNVGTGAASEGTLNMERISNEFNLRPGMSIKGERLRFDVVGDISMPHFETTYDENIVAGVNAGRFTRSAIEERDTLGGSLDMQLTARVKEQSSLSFRFRVGQQNAAGTASSVTELTPGTAALDTNEAAAFDNRRRYMSGDMSWNQLFDNALLVASIGYARLQTLQTWSFTDFNTAGHGQSDSVKTDMDIVPLRLGVELTPWERVAIRAGIQKNWFAESDAVTRDVDGVNGATIRNVSTALAEATGTANGVGLSFGMGFKLIRGLTIDTVVRQVLFFDGPNAIGGRTPGVFAQGTLVYRFGLSSNADDNLKPLLSYDEIQLY